MQAPRGAHGAQKPQNLWPLAIGAIGVVYGDIGTSPLYAFREAIRPMAQAEMIDRMAVLGVTSLILWALIVIVTLKYVVILMKIDNNGEGGTLALMALARSVIYRNTIGFLFLGIAGASLFFGDAIITPAISVLSAVEGLSMVTPVFDHYVLPITIVIIIGLFAVQARGTASVSAFFGPVTCLWFVVLAGLGVMHLVKAPEVLLSFNPYYALHYLMGHGAIAFVTLGAVFLAVTGAEALYADLGHFGRQPIQLAWSWFVFPALALNYLGQAAMVLKDPSTAQNPFFMMAPQGFLLPLVLLATVATVIASQAVITGAYSLTRQAVSFGLLPQLVVKHTSAAQAGQIYMPQVNYLLMAGVILLVLLFKTSENLAAAYGISVTATMVVTAVMVFFIVWQVREWPLYRAVLVILPFLAIDCVFLGANLLKVFDGGWVSLGVAVLISAMMLTWIQGTFILNGRARRRDIRLDRFLRDYDRKYPDLARVAGTAFFLTPNANMVPAALLQNIRHNKVLHAQNIILSVKIEPLPHVEPAARAVATRLNAEFCQLVLRFGFKDEVDVQAELLNINRDGGLAFDWEDTSLFLSRRVIRSHARYGMPLWQDWIYVFLSKHAGEPTDFYKIPVARVIEIGKHVII
jgi:KUP system potassium uptake protein